APTPLRSIVMLLLLLSPSRPPSSTLFPYTTLFRSHAASSQACPLITHKKTAKVSHIVCNDRMAVWLLGCIRRVVSCICRILVLWLIRRRCWGGVLRGRLNL